MPREETACRRPNPAAILALVFLLFFPGLASAAPVSSEAAFYELYSGIIRDVDAGRLDRSVGREARFVKAGLEKEIGGVDTRQQEIRNEISRADGTTRDVLLDELVAIGAEKEKIYHAYREQLAGLPGVSAERAGSHEPEGDGGKDKGKKRILTFKSVPEDVTAGDFD